MSVGAERAVSGAPHEDFSLESRLRASRSAGRKLLVPYVMGGMSADWLDSLRAVAASGADAVEVGIPFSDPMIDGPVIQQAGKVALDRGTTPERVLAELSRADIGVPAVVMTYFNLVFRAGCNRFAMRLAQAGVSGAIVADLPLEEAGVWCEEGDRAGISTVLLIAPSTSTRRAARICERSRGFVYGIATMGVTGEREHLSSTATALARRLKELTERPVCIGVGVSTPDQAAQVCADADGVVVGSALVRRLLEGAGPDGAAEFVTSLREGIDRADRVTGRLSPAARTESGDARTAPS
jgi:tryptophan synthase alpha chain